MPDYTGLKPRNIIGLDLSLSSSGLHKLDVTRFLDGENPACITAAGVVESGVIATSDKLCSMGRMDEILARIAELVNEGDFVLIENNAFNAIGRAKSVLAELNGIVKFWLWRRKIEYVLVAPTTLKKFVLGKGKGDKSLILREVYKTYSLNAETDDEADACVLAHIGACLIGREEPRNQAQREVIFTLTGDKKKKPKRKKLAEAA